MRVPLSWVREFTTIPAGESGRDVAARLIRAGLEVETVETLGGDVTGTLVVAKVVQITELTEFKKPIRFCQVDVGADNGGVRGIICGARNFAEGDTVVVALPGAVLPGGFEIAARSTYGHTSDGMICSERELGLGQNHDGIIVLPEGSAPIGVDAGAILGIGEEVLDIAVTPDRGYALSIRGVAREVALAYGTEFNDLGTVLVDLPAPSGTEAPHECGSETDACALFTARTIVGFNPGAPSPQWMRARLVAAGMRSVSLAVDVTNYVMLELGQPLHAFDRNKLSGQIRCTRPTQGEKFETLDHVVRTLDADDIVIRDDSGTIGLAGVMGGLTTEIDDNTTDIVLEAAHFDASTVARVSRRHKLSSEASRRFERGVDRVLAPYASARAAELLLTLGGGTYVGMTAVESPFEPTVITMDAARAEKTAGMPISVDTSVELLTAVGCGVTVSDGVLTAMAPTWRPDLTDPADLVEEIVRLVGYDQLPSTLPSAMVGRGLTKHQRMRRRIGIALAGSGLLQIQNYPFVGAAELDALQIPADDERRRGPRLANPLSDERPELAATLLPGLIAAAKRNISRGNDDLALFDIAPVFRWPADRTAGQPPRPGVTSRPSDAELDALEALLPLQPLHVAVVLTGQRDAAGWWGQGVKATWADAIDAVRVIADAVGVEIEVRAEAVAPFHPGRMAAIYVAGECIGHAGELHPRVIAAMDLPARTAAAEVDIEVLIAHAPAAPAAPVFGTFPLAKEDLALVVDASVTSAQVEAALREGAGPLLESVRLFDVFTGSQVGEGKKSLAYALRFRAPDRTLTSEEIAAARTAALESATSAVGARLR